MSTLSPLVHSFVSHFGEMGSRWGINRTVGQIYALLYVSAKPLNADDVGEALGFSRSNVSMGLKELQAWRLVQLRHLPSDRREYFEAPSDAWEIFQTLAEERRRREIEPTLSMLRNALLEHPATEADRRALMFDPRYHDTDALVESLAAALLDHRELNDVAAQIQRQLERIDSNILTLIRDGGKK